MRAKSFLTGALLVVAFGASYYERERVRASIDYSDPLLYSRLAAVGISVDYLKEPLIAWKVVSGARQIKLTGGGPVQTCMDEHLRLGDVFEAPVPANLGEALERCKQMSARN